MLGLNKHSLLFPKLVYLRDGELIKSSLPKFASNPPPTDPESIKLSETYNKEEKQTIRLYKLSWTFVEEKKAQRFEGRGVRIPLPKKYIDQMESLVFAIPDNYMKAINHCSLMATNEWEHSYPFDTVIHEVCWKPAKSFVKVAMHLLSDCIYDEETKYYNRHWESFVIFKHMALLNFWYHQSGIYTVFKEAGFKISTHQDSEWTIESELIYRDSYNSEAIDDMLAGILMLYKELINSMSIKEEEIK